MDTDVSRGDVFFADLEPVVGSEQGGVRPVLVVQNDTGNRHSATTIVAAITCKRKPHLPTHVCLSQVAGLQEGSTVLLEQVRTIDRVRLSRRLGALRSDQMRRVDRAIIQSLGILDTASDRMVMTLCRSCVQAFRTSGDYLLRRVDFSQEVKEPCMMCNVRSGYDFEVIRK